MSLYRPSTKDTTTKGREHKKINLDVKEKDQAQKTKPMPKPTQRSSSMRRARMKA